jgi:hypothetical protein
MPCHATPCHKIEMLLFPVLKYSEHTSKAKQSKTNEHQMSTDTTTTTNTNFDGIHVSKGFVRGLQGQVLKLEQVQQSLIQQLEHANNHASEYHATAVSWQHKYDNALHEMNEIKQALERETLLRMSREQELEHFKNLLQEQLTFHSNSNSSSSSSSSLSLSSSLSPHPAHPAHPYHCAYAREPMSPVSIPSSPRPTSPSSSSEKGSPRTTDCSGDPICDSDTE